MKLEQLYSIAFILCTVLLPSIASAEIYRVGDITVKAAWARASFGTARPAAAFMTIENTGKTSDTLLNIETPIAGVAEIHRTVSEGDVSKMGAAGPLLIQAGDHVMLAPGGFHIMLMMLKKPLKKGESFTLTLNFENAGSVELIIQIYDMGVLGPES